MKSVYINSEDSVRYGLENSNWQSHFGSLIFRDLFGFINQKLILDIHIMIHDNFHRLNPKFGINCLQEKHRA
jgi:hypothetical protein